MIKMELFDNKNIVQEKKESFYSKFSSFKNFFVDVLIVSAIIYFIITQYNIYIFSYISNNLLAPITISWLNSYLSYIVLGLFYVLLDLFVTWGLITLYNKIRRRNG